MITADDVRAFFVQRYTAGAMIAVGCRPTTTTRCWPPWPAALSPPWRPGSSEPCAPRPTTAGTDRFVDDDTEQVQIVIGGRGNLARDDEACEALDVVNQALGGGLEPAVRGDPRASWAGLTGAVVGRLVRGRGSAVARSAWCAANADEVVRLVHGEIDRLVADGITDDEGHCRGYLTGAFELGLEDTGARMACNGGQLCTTGRIRPVVEQVSRWTRSTKWR